MNHVQLSHTDSGQSPFDTIRRVDSEGEHWMGRDLMKLAEYARWENFDEVVVKARNSLALVEGEESAQHHFVIRSSDGGRWGNTKVDDVRLTRFGAYLVAMAGDDTKLAVAQARIYFAVQTRKAEIVERDTNSPAIPQSFGAALALAAAQQLEIEARDQKIAVDAPKVELVDTYVDATDATLIKVVAAQHGVSENRFRDYLVARKVIYKRRIDQYRNRAGKQITDVQWLACTKYLDWFTVKDQLDVPKMRNDQYRTTLYVTPTGKVGVARMIRRDPIDPPEQLALGA